MRIVEGLISEHLDSITPLLQEHWEEIARNKALMVLSPDKAKYQALEAAGKLFTLLLLNDADEVVGYSVNVIDNHLHYSGLVASENDVLFVKREYRGMQIGASMLAATEAKARDLGARLHFWRAKGDTALQMLLERAGYPVQDIVFSKEL